MNFIDMGQYFGYPTCCIESFLFNVATVQVTGGLHRLHNEDQIKAADNTGFVPCAEHVKQIAEGKITLEELITDRKCPTPFPNGTTKR